jgi:hypothetical protein
MGGFKDIYANIQEWLAKGRGVDETYIYFKDYITYEQVAQMAEREAE